MMKYLLIVGGGLCEPFFFVPQKFNKKLWSNKIYKNRLITGQTVRLEWCHYWNNKMKRLSPPAVKTDKSHGASLLGLIRSHLERV